MSIWDRIKAEIIDVILSDPLFTPDRTAPVDAMAGLKTAVIVDPSPAADPAVNMIVADLKVALADLESKTQAAKLAADAKAKAEATVNKIQGKFEAAMSDAGSLEAGVVAKIAQIKAAL